MGGRLVDGARGSMAFIVNSSPGAGLRFEPSVELPNAKAALGWAAGLGLRGMQLIRIKDTETGQVFDEAGLRAEIARQYVAAASPGAI
jgi:hypothetical protein